MDYRRFWKGFWQLADPKTWVSSTVPVTVGASLAYSRTGRFEYLWFFLLLIVVYFIEIGKNAVNEIIDFRSGVDGYVTFDKKTPFSGGKKTIIEAKLTIVECIYIAVFSYTGAAGTALILFLFKDIQIFWFVAAGIFASLFYSLPPFKFSYRGLGEMVIGITYGPVLLSAAYFVMAGKFERKALIVSLPVCFLVVSSFFINQFPDYEADKQGKKKNWVVRLGKEKALRVFTALFAASYTSFLGIFVLYKNPIWLLGFASLPLAIQAIKAAKIHLDDIPKFTEANIKTILIYQLTGLFMVISAISNMVIHK